MTDGTFGSGGFGSGDYGAGPYGRYEIPASETPEGQARIQEYYSALGAYVAMFSRAEIATQTALRFYSGLQANKAHILFNGTRADTGIDLIKKLAAEGGLSQAAATELSDFLAHLRAINTVRNGVLHYGVQDIAEGDAFVEKALFGVDAQSVNVTRFPISTEAITQMTTDLQKIIVFLTLNHSGRPEPQSDFARNALGSIVSSPWQYTPPQQPQRR